MTGLPVPSSFPARPGALVAPGVDPVRRRVVPLQFTRTCSRGIAGRAMLAAILSMTLSASDAAISDAAALHSSSQRAVSTRSIADDVAEAARRFGIPERWIRAVMRAESAGDTRAISPKGAMGLMQLMPQTWTDLRLRHALGHDPFDPHDNILAGAAYLREMHDRYGWPGFLAAYNVGPQRYDDHLATGRPLPAETRAYVAVVAQMIGQDRTDGDASTPATMPDPFAWLRAALFVARPSSGDPDMGTPSGGTSRQVGRATAFPVPTPPATRPKPHVAVVDLSAIVPRSDGLFVQLSPAE